MEPHIIHVTAQNRLVATVEAAVEKAVRRVLDTRASAAADDMPGGKNWLTNAEAQVYLGLSKATLARWRADETLPYSRLGGSVYYRRADIETLLERHAVTQGGDSSPLLDVPVLSTCPPGPAG